MAVMADPPPSTPCIGTCAIDQSAGICVGCGRTLDEIVAWGSLDEAARRAMMATLPERLAQAFADRSPLVPEGAP